jgi:hypothetical protein
MKTSKLREFSGLTALGGILLAGQMGAAQASPIIHTDPTATPFTGGVSYTGADFTQDDEYEVIHFTVGSYSAATFKTFGADGGSNGAGASIASGGFVPAVSLFSGNNGQADDYWTIASHYGDGSGGSYDVNFSVNLNAGDYYAVLAVYDNADSGYLPASLVPASPYTDNYAYYDSASALGTDNFTDLNWGDGSGGPFWTSFFEQRNGGWALDISLVDLGSPPPPVGPPVSGTPEPGTLSLYALGLGAFYRAWRRTRPAVPA